jgi:intracellular septation protein A
MKDVILRILGDFLATIAFIILYLATHNIVLATSFAIGLGLAQIAWLAVQKKPIAAMQWMSLGLVLVFGGVTIFTGDSVYIRLKASITHAAIAAVMLKRGWQLPYMPPVVRQHVPDAVLVTWGYWWAAVMGAMALANVYVSLTMDMVEWSIFMTVIGFGKLAVLGAQFWDVRRRIAASRREAAASQA